MTALRLPKTAPRGVLTLLALTLAATLALGMSLASPALASAPPLPPPLCGPPLNLPPPLCSPPPSPPPPRAPPPSAAPPSPPPPGAPPPSAPSPSQPGPAAPGTLIRTVRVAPPGVDPNGASAEPSLTQDGFLVAFASQASNLGPVVGNRRVSNIYLFDVLAGRVDLVSAGLNGQPANGASSSPSISADGKVIAFASQATNLVAGVHTQFSEIYVRVGSAPIRLLSRTFQAPDGDATQPVVSADGRFVAFTSASDNVIAGDDNANSDVFVVDLATGALRRVSVSGSGRQGNGAASNPSISRDGRLVSFTSTAPNLVPGDRNHVADVFVHNTVTGGTRRVSVSSGGREQHASIAAPFTQVSDLSADGRYVVFDSGARNLVRGPTSDHTQVFRHSLITGHTSLVSASSSGRHGNNDSFAPAISADGRVTAFESLADNLASRSAPGENIFAKDRASRRTLTLDVAPDGGPRGPELGSQLLQRPAVSANGRVVAFASGANNLVANDYNGADDLFLRAIVAP